MSRSRLPPYDAVSIGVLQSDGGVGHVPAALRPWLMTGARSSRDSDRVHTRPFPFGHVAQMSVIDRASGSGIRGALTPPPSLTRHRAPRARAWVWALYRTLWWHPGAWIVLRRSPLAHARTLRRR